ncbi:ferritin-like domain-containing protein [Candidatus Protochlamydia sp. W-9]|uniref:ferritin-like domain-containing protein n=1 Tax=Candidatus Protochlamydia sp. W-9 TaxID=1785087 RepID=UPI00096A25E4|nr:ferritin-like domain-containing protein [Candidatus Protochlamydia sp. W-9]
MKQQQTGLHKLFIDELQDMYSAEKQITEVMPKLTKSASLPELKEALMDHLKETKTQIARLEQIFEIMGLSAKENLCKAMEGILKEGEELTKIIEKSSTLDAAIISAAQKVEHYEIASYGTLCSFAKHLQLNSQIQDLLQDTLDEEKAADKKLTKLGEGSFFTSGVNAEAAEAKK